MASLLQELRGKVDLIYIDPPFDVGADFSMSVAIFLIKLADLQWRHSIMQSEVKAESTALYDTDYQL